MSETREVTDTFHSYGLSASIEPGVGLLLELAGDSTWLSWEETMTLRHWLIEKAVQPIPDDLMIRQFPR